MAVELERVEILVDGGGREVARGRAAGVEHQDVDTAQRGAGVADEAGCTLNVRDVGNDRHRVVPDRDRGVFDRLA